MKKSELKYSSIYLRTTTIFNVFLGVRLKIYKGSTILYTYSVFLKFLSKTKKNFLYNSCIGHNVNIINSSINVYSIGIRDNICLLSYEKSLDSLQIACLVCKELGRINSTILFINTFTDYNDIIKVAAGTMYQPALLNNFASGSLTNKLIHILPTIIFVSSTKKYSLVLKESRRLNIPIFSINDTNISPDLLSFPVIASDDCLETQHYVLKVISYSFVLGLLLLYLDTAQ
jgi:ribosomal protein S2